MVPGPGLEAAELLLGDKRSSKEEALGDGSGAGRGRETRGRGGSKGRRGAEAKQGGLRRGFTPATEDALQRNHVGAGGQLGRGAGSDACVVVKVQPRRRSYGEEKEAPGSDDPEDGVDKGAHSLARGGRRVEGKGDRAEALPGGASEGNEGESEGSRGEEASARVRGAAGPWAERTAGKQAGLADRLSLTLKINK